MAAVEGGVTLHHADMDGNSASPEPVIKRKRDDEGGAKSKRAAKRKKTKSNRPEDDRELDTDLEINTAIGKMDGPLLADLVARQTKRFEPKLSLVELEDRRIPEKAFLDTSDFAQARTKEHLPAFIEQFTPSKDALKELCQASSKNASPHTLVVTSAGLRAADLTRALRKFQTKTATVAKLFAKHIKLSEAITSTQNTRMNFGVGTPQRLIDLIDKGALSLDSLQRLVVDVSHINVKKQCILDMRETQAPLVDLLTRQEIRSRYGVVDKSISLLFY